MVSLFSASNGKYNETWIIAVIQSVPPTDLQPPTSCTHSVKQWNEKQYTRVQGKWSEVENIASQECKQKQKSSHTGKIKKQKTR